MTIQDNTFDRYLSYLRQCIAFVFHLARASHAKDVFHSEIIQRAATMCELLTDDGLHEKESSVPLARAFVRGLFAEPRMGHDSVVANFLRVFALSRRSGGQQFASPATVRCAVVALLFFCKVTALADIVEYLEDVSGRQVADARQQIPLAAFIVNPIALEADYGHVHDIIAHAMRDSPIFAMLVRTESLLEHVDMHPGSSVAYYDDDTLLMNGVVVPFEVVRVLGHSLLDEYEQVLKQSLCGYEPSPTNVLSLQRPRTECEPPIVACNGSAVLGAEVRYCMTLHLFSTVD